MKQYQKTICVGMIALLAFAMAVCLLPGAMQAAGVPATSDDTPVKMLTIILALTLVVFVGLTLYRVFRKKPVDQEPKSSSLEHTDMTDEKDDSHE